MDCSETKILNWVWCIWSQKGISSSYQQLWHYSFSHMANLLETFVYHWTGQSPNGPCKRGYPCLPSEFQSLVCRYFRRFMCCCLTSHEHKTSIACCHFVALMFQGRVACRNLPLAQPYKSCQHCSSHLEGYACTSEGLALTLSLPSLFIAFSVKGLKSSAQPTLTATQLHPTTLRALPSLSILHKPAHSPSFLLSSTRISWMQCSAQRASTSFTYIASSQLLASTHRWACRLWMSFSSLVYRTPKYISWRDNCFTHEKTTVVFTKCSYSKTSLFWTQLIPRPHYQAKSLWFYPHLVPTSLFQNPAILNFFHVPWDFNIVVFDCTKAHRGATKHKNSIITVGPTWEQTVNLLPIVPMKD